MESGGNQMGPNNIRHVVWALDEYFFKKILHLVCKRDKPDPRSMQGVKGGGGVE